MAEAGPTECENQKNIIGILLKNQLRKGDTWYLIDTKWYKQWKKYVGYDSWDTSYIGEQSAFPGPIDNSPLFREGSPDILKENLIDELEYMLVPEEAWNKLVQWYDVGDGQSSIARNVIEQGMFVKHCKVEVYLMELKLCTNSNLEDTVAHQFSRADTIADIEKVMRQKFDIADSKDVRLWNKYISNTYEQLNKPESSVQDAGLYQGQVIVVEERNDDDTWPRQTRTSEINSYNSQRSNDTQASSSSGSRSTYNYSGTSGCSTSFYNSSYDSYKSASSTTPGLCGLSNLGNTCFMNSAIQCMSNVPELTNYFLKSDWRKELNLDNPLGNNGEIATSYAELVHNMWSGHCSYMVPRNFKVAVGRFAPQFSGYQQQDSQELMAFLLDGLHEDLNRIKKKPYFEQKDSEGRPDSEVAKEAWENYLKRNDSIIVDIFHGLLKSTLVCPDPECRKVSVKFDPICYLSLPLPDKKERQIEVFFVPLDPEKKPKHYKLTVPQRGTVNHLCKALSKLSGVHPEKMMVTDVYNRRFHKLFTVGEPLNNIMDRDDIFIYEVPISSGENASTILLPVYMREKKMSSGCNGYQRATPQLFGQPMLVAAPRQNCTYQMLYNCVLDKMVRYVRIPDDNDEWWRTSKKSSSSASWSGDSCDKNIINTDMDTADDDSSSNNKSSSTATSSSSSSMENDDDLDTEPDADGNQRSNNSGFQRLFTFQLVNSYGTTEVDKLPDDGQIIKFSDRWYVAIDWHPTAKSLFYDEKASEELEVDDSVNQRVSAQSKKNVIQLTECLDMFTTTEKLGEQDPWYCPKCKTHQRATKKFDLWQLPQVLVIHLKRFSYNRYWRDKLDTFIEYPIKGLQMKKWVINKEHGPALYDLISVCNHYGGMGGGHYTAYAKNKEDTNWYYFDDSSVVSATEDCVTKAGYVLVYRLRTDTNPPAPPAHSSAPHTNGTAASQNSSGGDDDEDDDDDDEMDVN